MASKLAKTILRLRKVILPLFLLLTVLSVFFIGKANINYDLAAYLSEQTQTRRGLEIMQREFGSTEQITVLLENASEEEALRLSGQLSGMEGVLQASFSADTDVKDHKGIRYSRISLYSDNPDTFSFDDTLDAFLSRETGHKYTIISDTRDTKELKDYIFSGVVKALIIAAVVVIGVLFLTSNSYIEPLLFTIVLICSILINMGTNFVFDSISFITFAVAPILQLALAMDYSIMLLHTFVEIRDSGIDDETALRLALERSFMPVSSSSLTTIAGLVSLMFMSFTIGFDIGIVLSKGILISMLTVFLLMPALIMVFSKTLRTTAHKPVSLGGKSLARLAVKSRRILPAGLALCVAAACVLQPGVEYTFNNPAFDGQSQILYDVFGDPDALVVLLPARQTDEEFDKQRRLVDDLMSLTYRDKPAVLSVTGMVTTAAQVIKYYSPAEVGEMLGISPIAVSFYFGAMGFDGNVRGDTLINTAANLMPENDQIRLLKSTMDFAKRMFISESHSRLILLTDDVPSFTGEGEAFLDQVSALLSEYYPDGGTYITGNLMFHKEISEAFDSDRLIVSIITIAAIFLIVCLSFRSVWIPLLLICAIQGAVWLNTAVNVISGEGVFFMCYLICLAIQMGATIDYGILLTSNYRHCRAEMDRAAALGKALTLSMPTILTSGLILFTAGGVIGIGKFALSGKIIEIINVYFIYSIGRMLARGTAFSLIMVLLFLPPSLFLFDKAVMGRLPAVSDPPHS